MTKSFFGTSATQSFTDGTETEPVGFESDPTTGIYYDGAFNITVSGTTTAKFYETYVQYTVPIQLADGTVSLPSLCFTNNTNDGIYRIGSHNYGFTSNGTKKFEVSSSALTASTPLQVAYNSGTTQIALAMPNGTYNQNTTYIDSSSYWIFNNLNGNRGFIFNTNASTAATAGLVCRPYSTTVTGNNLSLQVGDGTSTYVTPFQANHNSNVTTGQLGISTSTSSTLTLQGTSTSTNTIKFKDNTTDRAYLKYDHSANTLAVNVEGTDTITSSSTGVTLGTGVKLNLDGSGGAAAIVGSGTFTAGSLTVNTTSVTANSIVLVNYVTTSNPGGIIVTVTAGVSVNFNNGIVLDNSSVVNWLIIN